MILGQAVIASKEDEIEKNEKATQTKGDTYSWSKV